LHDLEIFKINVDADPVGRHIVSIGKADRHAVKLDESMYI